MNWELARHYRALRVGKNKRRAKLAVVMASSGQRPMPPITAEGSQLDVRYMQHKCWQNSVLHTASVVQHGRIPLAKAVMDLSSHPPLLWAAEEYSPQENRHSIAVVWGIQQQLWLCSYPPLLTVAVLLSWNIHDKWHSCVQQTWTQLLLFTIAATIYSFDFYSHFHILKAASGTLHYGSGRSLPLWYPGDDASAGSPV